jgi:DNA polymerase-3 subunit epsilon
MAREKLLHLDLETTGLDEKKHGITQIAGMVEIDGEIVETFNFHVKPYGFQEITKEALEINGTKIKDLNKFPAPGIVYKNFIKVLEKYIDKFDKTDKFHMVGYNCQSFDSEFLREFFINNKNKFYGGLFWSATIDVMALAANHLRLKRHRMSNFQLKTVAEELGIEVDETKLHDALYDIELTREIFEIVRGTK